MPNPFSAMFDDTRETIGFVIFAIMAIFVLAEIGIAFGMPEFTNSIISSIGFGVLLVLAIPPIGVIIAIIIFIKKAVEQPVGF
jgi:uncharacterized membrane protein